MKPGPCRIQIYVIKLLMNSSSDVSVHVTKGLHLPSLGANHLIPGGGGGVGLCFFVKKGLFSKYWKTK